MSFRADLCSRCRLLGCGAARGRAPHVVLSVGALVASCIHRGTDTDADTGGTLWLVRPCLDCCGMWVTDAPGWLVCGCNQTKLRLTILLGHLRAQATNKQGTALQYGRVATMTRLCAAARCILPPPLTMRPMAEALKSSGSWNAWRSQPVCSNSRSTGAAAAPGRTAYGTCVAAACVWPLLDAGCCCDVAMTASAHPGSLGHAAQCS